MHGKEVYTLNEKLMVEEFSKNIASIKQESMAIEKLYMVKDSNVRKRADIAKLRSRLENLKSDIQIHQMSNKLKM